MNYLEEWNEEIDKMSLQELLKEKDECVKICENATLRALIFSQAVKIRILKSELKSIKATKEEGNCCCQNQMQKNPKNDEQEKLVPEE